MRTRVTAEERMRTRATILSKVEYSVSNSENEETKRMIEDGAVYNKHLDLTVLYVIPTWTDYGFIVTYDMLKTAEISEEELKKTASKNTAKNHKFIANRISDEVAFYKKKLGMLSDSVAEKDREELDAVVFTTESRRNGANVLLFKKVFQKVAEELESDLYILPTSVDDVLAVPMQEYGTAKELKELLKTINMLFSSPKEVLSYKVYKYCRADEKLSIASEGE